jgi:glycolate oxidase FAD binding subunit
MAAVAQSREGTAGEAIDGVTPRLVAEPTNGERCAAALAAAARGRLSTVIRGGGTKSGWGRPVDAIDFVVSTRSLGDLLVHRDGDLTVTVGAGMLLTRLNARLATRGQWLPVDSAFDGTTVGGALATNDSGPFRHRFGTPRDLLIGITLALTDGRVVKSGGTVVKNVAGYDLGKLVTGSYGGLALIVDATFKLLPIPAASGTVIARYAHPMAVAKALEAIRASTVEPAALDVHVKPGECRVLVRFASSPAATDAQIATMSALLDGATVVRGAEERALWTSHERDIWTRTGAIVRVSWLPASFANAFMAIERAGVDAGATGELAGRAGVGTGLLRIEGDEAAQIAAIQALRAQAPAVDHVVVLRASRAVKTAVDVWGTAPSAPAAALKHAFDPAGILNAGRGPL